MSDNYKVSSKVLLIQIPLIGTILSDNDGLYTVLWSYGITSVHDGERLSSISTKLTKLDEHLLGV